MVPALPEKLMHGANISDEVQTGGGPTGKMWCHEWFELPEVKLFITFPQT